MLRDIGRVLEYSNSKHAAVGSQAAASENGRDGRVIATTAKRLLLFACQVGWSAVSELLLPIAAAMEATASGLVAELENLADGGLTLLHQAVRSRNVDLVSLCHLLALPLGLLRCAPLLVTAVHSHAWQEVWRCHAVPSGGQLTCMLTIIRLQNVMLFVTAVITIYTLTMVMLVSALAPSVYQLCLAASGCSDPCLN